SASGGRRGDALSFGDELVELMLNRDASPNVLFHVLKFCFSAFADGVEARHEVAIVVVEQVTRLSDVRTPERPSAHAWHHDAIHNGGLALEGLHARDGEAKLFRRR